MSTASAVALSPPTSLVTRMASRYGIDPSKMLTTLKQTAFKVKEGEVSNEQMMALLVVAEEYGLNPWLRQIYAFPDKGGIVPVIGFDGWLKIINDHPEFDGLEFTNGPTDKQGVPEWIECTIYRKDRGHPIKVTEYFSECKRPTGPWQSHPRRMLRHKATIQAARIAFSFVGLYDEDEAQRIIEGNGLRVAEVSSALDRINQDVKGNGNGAVKEPHEALPEVTDEETTGPDFEYILAMVGKANNQDQCDLCEDLIRQYPNEEQRKVLQARLDERKVAIAQ